MTSLRQDVRDLRRVSGMLRLQRWWVARAIALGSLTLAASVGLSAVSAWLIVRASQMPPVMFLNVAAVGVRTLGTLRGVSRYLDRLAAHDIALRGVVDLRTAVYDQLAAGRTEQLSRLRRGDLLARTGVDVDDVGDVVVRALIPAGVAVVVSIGSVITVAIFSPASALVLAICLAISATVVPALSVRQDAAAEALRVSARSNIATATTTLVDRAAELALAGRRGAVQGELATAQADAERAESHAARSLASSAALAVLATGAAVLGSIAVAIPAAVAGTLSATELGVVALVPLAAFEATVGLPAAASQLRRSAAAARRITALLDGAAEPSSSAPVAGTAVGKDSPEAGLTATGLVTGWPGGPALAAPLDLAVPAGTSLAIVGPSGVGKTTLLLTLAGMLPPQAGMVSLDGLDPHDLRGIDRAAHVALTAEDAHIFTTSVRENLRVARGDLTDDEAREVLAAAGLATWVASLPLGLDTPITGETVSGGERRRLLIARALASPAPLLLLDEPAEHLSAEVADALMRDLLALTATGRSVVVVTHHTSALDAADAVIELVPFTSPLQAPLDSPEPVQETATP